MSVTKAITLGTVAFGPGAVLLLGDEQAAPRRHALESLGGKRYQTTRMVEFKAGEKLGIEGQLSKSLKSLLKMDGLRQTPQASSD